MNLTTGAKRLFVAATPTSQYLVQRAFSGRYKLQFASTLREAKHALTEVGAQELDMIISDVNFDDSQMFDLLSFVREVDHFDRLPFLVIQTTNSPLNLLDALELTIHKLGACGIVHLEEIGDVAAISSLQKAVADSFDKPVQDQRIDKRTDPPATP